MPDDARRTARTLVAVGDSTLVPFLERRPGCAKHVVNEDAAFQLSIYRLEPGARLPAHSHTRSHDIFVGVKGRVRIRFPAQGRAAPFLLGAGGVCSVPPGVRHELVNADSRRPAVFVLVHAPYGRFDIVADEGIGRIGEG